MIITIFRSRVKPEAEKEYMQWAERMNALAVKMPGYIAHKKFTAADGERVTIVEFESEETHHAWSQHPEHVEAKKKGRSTFYSEYRILVCTVQRESKYS